MRKTKAGIKEQQDKRSIFSLDGYEEKGAISVTKSNISRRSRQRKKEDVGRQDKRKKRSQTKIPRSSGKIVDFLHDFLLFPCFSFVITRFLQKKRIKIPQQSIIFSSLLIILAIFISDIIAIIMACISCNISPFPGILGIEGGIGGGGIIGYIMGTA